MSHELIVRPRFLKMEYEEDLGEHNPVQFRYGFKDRELAGKTTRRETIISFRCFVGDKSASNSPALLHVLGFFPEVIYAIPIPASKLQGHDDRVKEYVNTHMHQKLKQRPDTQTADAVYVISSQFTPIDNNSSRLRLRICRPEDTNFYRIPSILSNFLQSTGAEDTKVTLLQGENKFGRLLYTDSSAAQSFKNDLNMDFSSVFLVRDAISRPSMQGMDVFYIKNSCIEIMPVDRESRLSFFDNFGKDAFNFKVYGFKRRKYDKKDMAERDRKQSMLTQEDYDGHVKEYTFRIVWNLKNGIFPAHQLIHLADPDRCEANDDNFALGVAPFHGDGMPNPLGIPDNRFIEQNAFALD